MPTSQGEVLQKLTELSRNKEGPVSAADIAVELKCSKATVTSLLSKLKLRGSVTGSGVEFLPTEEGSAKADNDNVIVTTTADAGLDEVSKFEHYGQIADMKPNEIACALEIFKEGDMLSMAHFDSVMAQAHIPMQPRDKWRNMYLTYLRLGTPIEQRDSLYPLPAIPPEAGLPSATVVAEAAKREEGRDWIVDGFDIHRAGEDLGEFTWKEALQAVAVKRGTGVQPLPQPQESSNLVEMARALRELNPDPTKPLTAEGILSLVRELDGMRGDKGEPPPAVVRYHTDAEGNTRQLAPDEPITIRPPAPPAAVPGKNYFFNPLTKQVEESPNDGRPFVITINQGGGGGDGSGGGVPWPMFGTDGEPVYDKQGNPVVANLEPMMKWMGFQGEQRRASEMHDAKVGAFKAVRENIGDVVSALKVAAQEVRGGGGPEKAATGAAEGMAYECGECHQQFMVPDGPFAAIQCPICKHEYSREEILA